LIGDDTARELFGMPVEINPHEKDLSWYQIGLISGYTPLRSLQLRAVTDSDVRRLGGLQNLQSLGLYDSSITDRACATIGRFPLLQHLSVENGEGSPSARITDEGLKSISGLTQLRSLYLHSSEITDDGLAHLGQLTALTNLGLSNSQIQGHGLSHLAQLPGLRYVWLENCPLQGDRLRSLAASPSLQGLTLAGSTATDEMLPHLIPLRSLQYVNFTRSRVTREGCRALLEARPDLKIRDADDIRVEP
ncbi:MAG: hypothetical protein KF861_16060, partial [Planctomycetaceae bacterium]|nr:hypothetical protein [Planctomycetaceae bacterium]